MYPSMDCRRGDALIRSLTIIKDDIFVIGLPHFTNMITFGPLNRYVSYELGCRVYRTKK